MNLKFRAPISTAVAIGSGVIVLLTFIFDLTDIRNIILGWVVIATAMALLIGVVNLVTVHAAKMRAGEKPLYSFVLILSLFITFTITVLSGPDATIPQWIFEYIQVPIETSLMAVMAVTLTYAAAQLLNRRPNIYSIIFVGVLIIILLGTGPILGIEVPLVQDTVRPWLTQVWASAGARGILIGVGLGTVATGIRILTGADRPFGG
jgi:hypothetical protein